MVTGNAVEIVKKITYLGSYLDNTGLHEGVRP